MLTKLVLIGCQAAFAAVATGGRVQICNLRRKPYLGFATPAVEKSGWCCAIHSQSILNIDEIHEEMKTRFLFDKRPCF